MSKPQVLNTPLYLLLHNEQVEEFNRQKKQSTDLCLRGADFRGLDLRNLHAEGLDLRDVYFRNTDLRGIDFRNAQLDGASIADANISGCYFPANISAEEIRLSLTLGTRMRAQSNT